MTDIRGIAKDNGAAMNILSTSNNPAPPFGFSHPD